MYTLLIIYITLGIVRVGIEISKPYGGSMLPIDFLIAPITLWLDFIDAYKEARKIDKK